MKITNTYILTILTFLVLQSCDSNKINADKILLKNKQDTISYIIGLDYGLGIMDQEIEVNDLAIYKGLMDGLKDNSLLPDSIKEQVVAEFDEILKERLVEKGKIFLEENLQKGQEFMITNRTTEGVIELESGLQVKVMKEGKGKQPNSTDSVLVHYRAMFVDRTVFDMSYDRGPAGIRLNAVIAGLSEGIQLMKPGAIFELFIPPKLAYGDKTFASVIPGGSTLIYSIELIEIVKE